MKLLSGIILLHLLVLVRARRTPEDGMPYGSIIVLSAITTVYVLYMVFTMDVPEQ